MRKSPGTPSVTLMACKPCVAVRGPGASALDKRVTLGGMNEFHAAAKQLDTRVINFSPSSGRICVTARAEPSVPWRCCCRW
jgi:hypothetical protein